MYNYLGHFGFEPFSSLHVMVPKLGQASERTIKWKIELYHTERELETHLICSRIRYLSANSPSHKEDYLIPVELN